MKVLTDKHKKSIERAILILKIAMDRQVVPKYKKEFARDIKHLIEIALHVDSIIANPMFSMLMDKPCELAV